jgi:kinesin family protein 11
VSACESTITSLTEAVAEKLDNLHKSTTDATIKLQSLAKEAATTNIDNLSSYSKMISEQLIRTRSTLGTIQEKNEVEDEALQAIQTSFSEMQKTLQDEFVSWSMNLTSTSSIICGDLQESSQKGLTTVEEALGDVHSVLDSILRGIQQYIKDVLSSLEQSQRLANDAAQVEITRLRQQNENLIQILKEEKIKADLAKEMLMHRMSELLDVFMTEQQLRMQVNVNGLCDNNRQAEMALGSYLQQQTALIGDMSDSGNSLRTTLQDQGESTKRMRDGAFKVCRCIFSHGDKLIYFSYRH